MNQKADIPGADPVALAAPGRDGVYPQAFSIPGRSPSTDAYLSDPLAAKLAQFFQAKGLSALKDEDRREQWYEDWLAYQAEHRLYAQLLCPEGNSTRQGAFDLLRYARFLELFAYFSPAHGYSLQVTFLGLFPILMGSSAPLKEEAIASLRAGGLLAFGVSERAHGSDLLGNEFTIKQAGPGRLVADGSKYYIGNSNAASIISILARRVDERLSERARRAPFVLFALRPKQSSGYRNVRKIHTLGVRAGFVGEFEVKNHELPDRDVIADGRRAWDAVIGTVTLGKFFLGFGSIGICEHALEEAAIHLRGRILYGKPAIEMPHIRSAIARTYARITAMKLYAYRALDYVQAADETDRRYLLFCAVQKAKVSTEGLKVMDLLLDCIGAKGFESDTYFEMALRDAQLIPRLEGSTHINLGLTAQFIQRYFTQPDRSLTEPDSMTAQRTPHRDNPYLMRARAGAINTIGFPHYLTAYRPLMAVPNVRLFAKQARALALFLRCGCATRAVKAGTETAIALGQCQATVAYAQLVAENALRLGIPREFISAMFELFVNDLSGTALALEGSPHVDSVGKILIRRLVVPVKTTLADGNAVAERSTHFGEAR